MKTAEYESITDQIVRAIEAGITEGPRLPWHSRSLATPTNAITGRHYSGINVLLLWLHANTAGYSSGQWATYRQWSAAGAQVRKGERATMVVLWKVTGGTGEIGDRESDEPVARRSLARAFYVFNADQVDGFNSEPAVLPEVARNASAQAFFDAQLAKVWHGSDCAFYDPGADIVSLPSFSSFPSVEAYYSVYAHELTHWTGAKSRLARDLTGRFGSDAYAMEELVAELGAAFVAGHLQLAAVPRDDHAAYISSWLKVLGSDPRAIVTAASRAQAAADYLIAGAADRDAPGAIELKEAA